MEGIGSPDLGSQVTNGCGHELVITRGESRVENTPRVDGAVSLLGRGIHELLVTDVAVKARPRSKSGISPMHPAIDLVAGNKSIESLVHLQQGLIFPAKFKETLRLHEAVFSILCISFQHSLPPLIEGCRIY